MYSDIAIKVENLGKCYAIYEQPRDRLKQFLLPRLNKLLNKQSKKYYREFWALNNVSFEVKKGETLGIIGRNGSGKSTLLQMICGTLTPTTGSIYTQGRIAALLELGSGFNPEFTGRENVYLNSAILGLSRNEIDQRLEDIIQFADIGEFVDQPVKTYSSGMIVRLAFAVIAHVNADILVIDEALAVGDAFFTQKCMRFLRSFMQQGTVIFVSHDTASVRSLCNKAIWIDQGKFIDIGTPKAVCERYLEAFFESIQGSSGTIEKKTKPELSISQTIKDQRQDFINASNLRNDIRLFQFNPDALSFGKKEAEIMEVNFLDSENHPLSWIVGGEHVVLRIRAVAYVAMQSIIMGFYIKDRLGQILFGDNTYLNYIDNPQSCFENNEITAEFRFQMPRLSAGDYSVCPAVAHGSQHEHIHQHWVHDALMFRSESTSIATGIIGLPMTSILLNIKS